MKLQIKKAVALLLAMMMVFSLAACRRQVRSGDLAPEDDSEKTTDTQEATQEETDPVDDANDESDDGQEEDSDDKSVQGPDEESEIIGTWSAEISAGAFLNSLTDKVDSELMKYLDFDEIMIHVQLTLHKDFTYTLELDEDAIEQTKKDIIHTLRIGIPNILLDLSKYTDEEIVDIMKQRGLDIDSLFNGRVEGSFWYEDGRLYYTFEATDIDLSQFAEIELRVGEFAVIGFSEEGDLYIDSEYLPIIFRRA